MFPVNLMRLTKLVTILAFLLLTIPAYSSEYKAANFKGKADITKLGCAKGDFWDPRGGGECWSCEGDARTLNPVTSDKACKSAAGEMLSRASQKSDHITTCPDGSFYDPREGGECWTCPANYKRTGYGVTSDKACSQAVAKQNRKAKYSYNTGSILKACKNGTFANAGETKCYTCENGWRHNGSKRVGDNGVCYKPATEKLTRATKVRDLAGLSCPSGQFYDPIKGGSCWTCPADANRTGYAVDSDKACAKPVPGKFSSAKFKKSANVTKLGCDHLGAKTFFDLADGGTCWECPQSNPVRSLYGVTDQKACTSNTCGTKGNRPCFVWERFPSCNEGLAEDFLQGKCVSADPVEQCKSIVKPFVDMKMELPKIPYIQNYIDEMNRKKQELQRDAAKLMPANDLADEVKKMAAEVEKNSAPFLDFVKKLQNAQRDLLSPEFFCGTDVGAKIRILERAGLTTRNLGNLGLAAAEPTSFFPDLITPAYAAVTTKQSVVHVGVTGNYVKQDKTVAVLGIDVAVDTIAGTGATYLVFSAGKSTADWSFTKMFNFRLEDGPLSHEPTLALGPYAQLSVDLSALAQPKISELVAKLIPSITSAYTPEVSFLSGKLEGTPSLSFSWPVSTFDVRETPDKQVVGLEGGVTGAVKILYYNHKGQLWLP